MKIDYEAIGARIKAARLQSGLTQKNLAEKLCVSPRRIGGAEKGISKISLDLLADLSVALDRDITFFITGMQISSENYLEPEIREAFSALNNFDKKRILAIVWRIKELDTQ